MSKYFLPTAILLSIFIYVDLLPMHKTNDAEIAVLSRFLENAREKKRVKKADKAFFDLLENITENSHFDAEKFWQEGFVNPHFGARDINNLKDCKKICDQRKQVCDFIKRFNNDHKDKSPVVYSRDDSEKIDKKVIEVLNKGEDEKLLWVFLVKFEERLENHWVHEMRSSVPCDGSDCTRRKSKKFLKTIKRSLSRKSKSKGVEKNDEFSEGIRERMRTQREYIKRLTREKAKRIYDSI